MGRREEPPGIQRVGSRLFGGDGQFFPACVPMGGNMLRLRRAAGAIPRHAVPKQKGTHYLCHLPQVEGNPGDRLPHLTVGLVTGAGGWSRFQVCLQPSETMTPGVGPTPGEGGSTVSVSSLPIPPAALREGA